MLRGVGGTRERVANLLERTGTLRRVMTVRRFAPIPTLSIVTYHHVADQDARYVFDPDVADATPAQFRRQMAWLAAAGTIVALDDVLAALDGAPLPPNPILVTFDDGYRSCLETAMPILRDLGIRATFFVATTFTTERRLYWWERIALAIATAPRDTAELQYPKPMTIRARDAASRHALTDVVKNTSGLDLPRFLDEVCAALGVPWDRAIETRYADELIMTWDQVRALAAAGHAIESHSRNHRVLQTLDDAGLRDELAGSFADLARELGRPPRAIAYPVGRPIASEPRIRAAIEAAGYRIGFSNNTGVNRMWPTRLRGVWPVDRLDIRRLSTDRSMSDAMFGAQLAIPRLAYPTHDR